MRKTLLAMLFLVLAGGLCRAGTNSSLQQFRQIESRYYSFDPQAFKSASCLIKSPLLSRELDALNRMLPGKVEFDAPLGHYRLVYRTPRDISIVDPVLFIKVISSRIADPARLKLGESQIKRAFKRQIAGIDTQVRSILEGYAPRDPVKLHVESIKRTGSGYKLHYRYDGMDATEEISGKTKTSFQNDAGTAAASVETFKPAPSGKLLLQHANVHVKGAALSGAFKVGVTYQTVKSVIFPKVIDVSALIGIPSMEHQTRVHYAIQLTDCKIL